MLGYFASPYNHQDPAIKLQRFKDVAVMTMECIKAGLFVISPIAHNVTLINETSNASGWAAWADYDIELLSRCDFMLVHCLEGWQESVGLAAEIEHCQQNDIPVIYLTTDLITPELIQTIKSAVEETRQRKLRQERDE